MFYEKPEEFGIVYPPGDIIAEWLTECCMSQKELAVKLNRPEKTISEIINAKTEIIEDTAIQLEKVTGLPASYWLALEQQYRLFLVRQKNALKAGAEIQRLKEFL